MKEITVGKEDAGQRLDKFLCRVLPAAPSSFLYRMLRKKNITLNGRKAEGKEKVQAGDILRLFLSEETLSKFQKPEKEAQGDGAEDLLKSCSRIEKQYGKLRILYEDPEILAVSKPCGLLSQKAAEGDLSLNEWLAGYLLKKGLDPASFSHFRPSAANRLDRNTQGLVLCAKTLRGSRVLSELLRSRKLRKYYLMVVKGKIPESGTIEGWLLKDEKNNRVTFSRQKQEGAAYTKTEYRRLRVSEEGDLTLLEAELITGKSHQLRAHLASIGHPILGDPKYGDRELNERFRDLGVRRQLLLSWRAVFPEQVEDLPSLSGRVIEDRVPSVYEKVLKR